MVMLTSLTVVIILQCIRSDQISRSVVSNSLPPHESKHTRPPCPSPTPGVHSDSCPSSQWCHPAISSFSSCPQSLPASESFPMSQLFAWGGQSTGVSAFTLSKYHLIYLNIYNSVTYNSTKLGENWGGEECNKFLSILFLRCPA